MAKSMLAYDGGMPAWPKACQWPVAVVCASMHAVMCQHAWRPCWHSNSREHMHIYVGVDGEGSLRRRIPLRGRLPQTLLAGAGRIADQCMHRDTSRLARRCFVARGRFASLRE